MKHFFKTLAIAILVPVLARGAALDIRIGQRNSSDTAWTDVIFAKQNSALIGTTTTGRPSIVTIGSGLDLTAGVLTATGGGGGAPDTATYITQTPNGSLSNEQALSVLASGIMRVSTTTGVVTSLTDSSGIAANISDETGSGPLVFSTSPAFTTNVKLANGAAPSTPAVADTAYDTNAWAAGRGAIQVHDGTANTYVVAALSSDVPSNGDVPTWGTGGAITWEPAVTAASTFGTDNVLLKSDGTSRGSQSTGIVVSDTNDITGVGDLTVANMTTTDLTITGSITGVMGVVNGGTGRPTGTTAYSLVATGTTATGTQQTLANGATTEILVGGGAAALPVWTTTTGTGAPVRQVSAQLTTPNLGTPSAATLTNATGLPVVGITMNTARLLGRTTAGVGAAEEITVGSGLSLAAGTLTATGGGSVELPWLDVITSYNGSGSATTTTGDISATSPTLTVASSSTFVINQGILIKGAGTAGAHHVSTITNVVGTTITIANNAITTVVGAVVQHDDSAAINAALAAAFNAEGGRVLLRCPSTGGYYRCNAPLNGSTNSILTLPQSIVYTGSPIRVELVGEVRNSQVGGGVMIDSTDAPAGTGTNPAVIAGAPTVTDTFTDWENVDLYLDGFTIVVSPNPTLSGVNGSNCLRLNIGDTFGASSSNILTEPTNASVGVITAGEHNNILVQIGAAQIVGFNVGIRASEHTVFSGRGPTLGFCKTGVEIYNPLTYSLHNISGSLCIESCTRMISKTGAGPQSVSLILQSEIKTTPAAWYNAAANQDIYDTGNTLRGKIEFACVINETGLNRDLTRTGATAITLENLYDPEAIKAVKVASAPELLWWPMNDAAGTTMTFSGAGVNGTADMSWVAGPNRANYAIRGNGTNTEAYSASAVTIGSPTITASGWFYLRDTDATQVLFESSPVADSNSNTFLCFVGGDELFFIAHGTGAEQSTQSMAYSTENAWVHIAMQVDTTTNPGTIRVWLNGVEKNLAVTSNTLTTSSNFADHVINILCRDGGGTPTFRADADASDFRLYSRTLTTKEVIASMTGGPTPLSNDSFSAGWDGKTTVAPSQNAVFDIFGTQINYPLTVYGAGTAYALTNTAAAIDFGTTDPTKVIDKAGTYMIFGQVHVSYNGATVTAETMTLKVRRTNNTAADVSAVLVIDLPGSSIVTNSYGTVTIPPFVYTSANADDSLSIFANVSATLAAGTVEATAIGTSLVALKIY